MISGPQASNQLEYVDGCDTLNRGVSWRLVGLKATGTTTEKGTYQYVKKKQISLRIAIP